MLFVEVDRTHNFKVEHKLFIFLFNRTQTTLLLLYFFLSKQTFYLYVEFNLNFHSTSNQTQI